MSVNYASCLSPYDDKGICGIPELHEVPEVIRHKITALVDLIRKSSHTVVHTGAGLSTSAGIADFRGPRGVWTLERDGKAPEASISFEKAVPTLGHMALVSLEQKGFINYLITQNVDGLHLRSGFPRNRLSILHGDMFLEACASCGAFYVRSQTPVPTLGLRPTGFECTRLKTRIRSCQGKLHDTVLDWEDELPEPDFSRALQESRKATLHICLGTSLQIFPAAGLPFESASSGGRRRKRKRERDSLECVDLNIDAPSAKVVIINLQPTKMDSRADMLIRTTIDEALAEVCRQLQVAIPGVKKTDGIFEPQISFLSAHTSVSEVFPYKFFPHPTDEASSIVDIAGPILSQHIPSKQTNSKRDRCGTKCCL